MKKRLIIYGIILFLCFGFFVYYTNPKWSPWYFLPFIFKQPMVFPMVIKNESFNDNVDKFYTYLCKRKKNLEEIDSCFSNLAIKRDNAIFCELINDPHEGSDPGWFISYKSPEIRKSDCKVKYFKSKIIGISDESNEICEKMSNPNSRNDCYYYLAFILNDISICNKSSEYKNKCITNIANLKNDHNLCQKIEDPIERAICIKYAN